MHSSPVSPRATVSPVSGSITFTSTCGITRPTVSVRRSRSSSARVIVDTGEVSVIPYEMATSARCISLMHRFITSTGHGEPAMIPVRSEVRSYDGKDAWSSCAMNIVGTPYTDVHRSSWIASSVATGSKAAAGMTMQAPCDVAPRFAITIPKQW